MNQTTMYRTLTIASYGSSCGGGLLADVTKESDVEDWFCELDTDVWIVVWRLPGQASHTANSYASTFALVEHVLFNYFDIRHR